ncbi:MAG: MarR family transcriptional regulator [Glaciihabitans sp.]|nr:MarR family transcriptional regulator [Glaciihabitans sp.]
MTYDCRMTNEAIDSANHYWFDDDAQRQRSIELLEAMRTYRAAESAMRRRTETSMGMGENDLLALRYILRAHRDQRSTGPKELAAYLGISSASTTVLLDRLAKGGHIRREHSPFDRRALIIVPTATTDDEIRHTLGNVHERMVEIAQQLSESEARIVIDFLTDMREAIDEIDAHAPSSSRRKTATRVSTESAK